MTPPPNQAPRPQKPRSASPAERSVEYSDRQRQLKAEAAERRLVAEQNPVPAPVRRHRASS